MPTDFEVAAIVPVASVITSIVPPSVKGGGNRIHYVITNGGDQPNVLLPDASVWYYYREADYEHITNLWSMGDDMAKAAAPISGLSDSCFSGYFLRMIDNDPIKRRLRIHEFESRLLLDRVEYAQRRIA